MKRPSYKFWIMWLIVLFLLGLMLHSEAMAVGTTYYVDDNCFGQGKGTIEDPFCIIQDGIEAALEGDTVQVAAGTYYENITMKSGVVIQGAGAGDNPSVHSIIDGGGSGSVVTAIDVDSAAKLDGFTITNGDSPQGGGIATLGSSHTVSNCTFSGNSASDGGGMANYKSSLKVTNCTFSANSATYGGGMYNRDSPLTVINCTFSANSATYGGGIANHDTSLTVTNSILWGDAAGEIYNSSSTSNVSYSDVQGGYPGEGNLDAAPLFVGGSDYHLGEGSPCIDTGTSNGAPDTDIEGNQRPRGKGYDMGAYEFFACGAMPWMMLLLDD